MCQRPNDARRGITAVFTMPLLVVFCGVLAFAIDIGYIAHARTELQRTADACAMAGAMCLPDKVAAKTTAQATAVSNHESVGPELQDSDVEFGYWNRNTATFTTPAPANRSSNAVRVTVRRTQASGNPLRLFFAKALGVGTSDVTATATATCNRGPCGPFVGIDWLAVPGGARTDSFDSQEGPYDPSRAYERGSICSDGPVDVGGNAIVRGDARAGKGYDVLVKGGGVVTGNIGSRVKPLSMPPPDATQAAMFNNNADIPKVLQGGAWKSPLDRQGDFTLNSGDVVNLPAGTYYFRNFSMEGGSTLNITGHTKIYVTGIMKRTGGAWVNSTGVASDLQVYLTGAWANITSTNDFVGVLYAPNTDVTLNGDSDLYGAIVGKTLKVTGSGFAHYDEHLKLDDVDLPSRTCLVD